MKISGKGQGQGHSRLKICFSWITSDLVTKCNNSKNKKLYQGVFNIHTKFCKNWKIFVGVMPLTKLDVFLLSLHGKKMFLVLLLWLNGKMLISCVKTITSINSYCQNEFIDILLDSIWNNYKFVWWTFSPWARNDSYVDYDLIYEDIVKTITSMDSYSQAKSSGVLLDSIWEN